jgi:hypothetical protein
MSDHGHADKGNPSMGQIHYIVKEVVRCGGAFKLRLVEDMAGGKYRASKVRGGGTGSVDERP